MKSLPFELSGGEKRRTAIAGVMAMEPEVLILDEPTAGLDPRGGKRSFPQISAYQKENGSTVLLVSPQYGGRRPYRPEGFGDE